MKRFVVIHKKTRKVFGKFITKEQAGKRLVEFVEDNNDFLLMR